MTEQHTVFALAVSGKTTRAAAAAGKEGDDQAASQRKRFAANRRVQIRHVSEESQSFSAPPVRRHSAVEESIKLQREIEENTPNVIHERFITMEASRGSMVIIAFEEDLHAQDEIDKLATTKHVPDEPECTEAALRLPDESIMQMDPVAEEEVCNETVIEAVESSHRLNLELLDLVCNEMETPCAKSTPLTESPDNEAVPFEEAFPLLRDTDDDIVPYYKNAINGSTAKGKSVAIVPKEKLHASLKKTRSDSRKFKKALNVAVFLKEGQGKLLLLENGKSTTAGEVKEIMLDNLSLPRKLQAVFAIWLVSPLLELQLKDHHVPFTLRKQWAELLKKFTTCKPAAIEQDEPVIVFQRNSFFPVHIEKKISDDRVVRRLFEEAKHNILMARYPVCRSDAIMLGGLLSRIEHGQFDAEKHCQGFYKKSFSHYLPERSCRHMWFGRRAAALESRLLSQYKRASECADDPKKCHRLFLEYCWALPFYGCAFFKGEVEQEAAEYKPWRSVTKTVFVGINRFGVTIFQNDKQEILLSLSYDELSWDYIPAAEEDGVDSFYLEFDTRSAEGEVAAEQLQVISPQAVMMDAMVDSCVSELNRLNAPKSPPISPSSADERQFFSDARRRPLVRTRKHNFSLSNPFKTK